MSVLDVPVELVADDVELELPELALLPEPDVSDELEELAEPELAVAELVEVVGGVAAKLSLPAPKPIFDAKSPPTDMGEVSFWPLITICPLPLSQAEAWALP